MSPVVIAGIGAPIAVLALAALIGLMFDSVGGSSRSPSASGDHRPSSLAVHRVARWADSPLDTPVPEARGAGARVSPRSIDAPARATSGSATLRRRSTGSGMRSRRLPDGMVILDATNRIEWANRRALSHLGIDLAQGHRPAARELHARAGVHPLSRGGEFRRRRGRRVAARAGATLSIQIVPFGSTSACSSAATSRRSRAVARMRRDFIANVSHELKTPLTVVAGFLETLQDVKLEARQRTRYLQLMAEQANSMQRLSTIS
jgi:two-component system phosphate regulon sensor histidine kinase PhoR